MSSCFRHIVFLLSLGIAVTPAFGQVPEEAEGVPGIPPGVDAGGRQDIGQPPASQDKLRSTGRSLQATAPGQPFSLIEATISDIHSALESGQISCEGLVRQYLQRIKTYGGQCVNYDKNGDGTQDYDLFMPSGKGVVLGVVSARPNAKSINAISSVNLRPGNYAALGFTPPNDPGPRSETDLIDDNPNMPDALEVARQLDRQFTFSRKLLPLQCIPIVIKDQMETFDMRTTDGSLTQFRNDRPPNDGTLVAKLRGAGAVIIGKANMDEYAGGTHRSSYGGQMCNPYATDRDGGSSSTGSAGAVSANLAVCGIAEESGGSIQEPGAKQGVVAMTATRGLVSRFGTWSAELIRERYGPECRTVEDTAKVLDVIRGFDPKDAITATQIGYTPDTPLHDYARATSLRSKRIGIVREFMPKITVNDAESIRVFNEEVIPTLKAAGAYLVESINPRDIANGWAVDDPTIPNISIQNVVAEMVPTLEPSFANPSTVPAPSTTTGLLPSTLRQVFDPVPALFPPGTDVIQKSVEMFFDPTKFPDTINLRKLASNGAGTLNQGRYGLDKMLVRRNDPQIKSVLDLSIDFNDLDGDGNRTEHLSFFNIDANGATVQRNRPGVSPAVGVPATPNGPTLDTQGEANHIIRQQSIREIVARILADNDLDALVYPFSTIPPKILTGTAESIAWAVYDNRANRGYNAFTDNSGLPGIAVPAGFTKVVYDRTTRGNTEALALNPPAVKREVFLPFSIVFLSRPWSEPTLLEIASAYEKARGPRTPPPDFSVQPPATLTSDPATWVVYEVAERIGNAVPFHTTDRGGASIQLSPSTEPTTVGYARIDAEGGSRAPSGMAAIGLRQNNTLVSEAAVPALEPIPSGRIYAEVSDSINTALAIVNPSATAATVTFSFTDVSGQLGSGSVTIPANGQISKFLDQAPYHSPGMFQGTFSFTSDVPVGVMAFRGVTNERGEFLLTTLPMIDTAGTADTSVVPHFADGDGWTTEVVLVNPTDRVMTGTVHFANADGGAVDVTVHGRTDSTFSYSIPQGASQKLATAGINAAMTSGSVRVLAEQGAAPTPLAVLSYKPDGITVSETSVSAIAGTAFRMYAESSGITGQPGNIQSGIAIANTSSAPVTVTFDLTHLDGSSVGLSASLTIPAFGQTSKFLGEIFSTLPGSFQGLVRISTPSDVAVAGLRARYNERGDFLMMTTTPENEANGRTGDLKIMPQIAIGGGNTSQITLFSASPGQSSSGTVRLISQNGEPLAFPR